MSATGPAPAAPAQAAVPAPPGSGWEAANASGEQARELDAAPAPTPAPALVAAPATNATAPAAALDPQLRMLLEQLQGMGYSLRAATLATSHHKNMNDILDWLRTNSSQPEPVVAQQPQADVVLPADVLTLSYITMENVYADHCLACGHYCKSAELWEWLDKTGKAPKCLVPGCCHQVDMDLLPPRAIVEDPEVQQQLDRLAQDHGEEQMRQQQAANAPAAAQPDGAGPEIRQRACACGDEHCMHLGSAQAAIVIDDDPTQVCHVSPTQEDLDQCWAVEVKAQSERMAQLQEEAQFEKASREEAERLAAEDAMPVGRRVRTRQSALVANASDGADAAVSPKEKPSRKKQKTQQQLRPSQQDRRLCAFRNNLPPNCTPFRRCTSTPFCTPDQLCMCTSCTFQGEPCTKLASQELKWIASDGTHMIRFLCARCWNSEQQQRSNEEAVELGGCHSGGAATVGATAAAAGEAPEGNESTEPDGSGTDNTWYCRGCGSSCEGQHAAEDHEAACKKYLTLFE